MAVANNYDKAPVRDLTFRKGQTMREKWKFKNPTTNEYLNLAATNVTIVMQIRETPASNGILKELKVGNGFTLNDDDTAIDVNWNVKIKAGKWVYDIRAVFSDDYTDFLAKGKFEVIDAVTE
jgi:hypothetical protein